MVIDHFATMISLAPRRCRNRWSFEKRERHDPVSVNPDIRALASFRKQYNGIGFELCNVHRLYPRRKQGPTTASRTSDTFCWRPRTIVRELFPRWKDEMYRSQAYLFFHLDYIRELRFRVEWQILICFEPNPCTFNLRISEIKSVKYLSSKSLIKIGGRDHGWESRKSK